ncbi:MAG: hypothetical protein HYY24_00065 [Verrucomicrobia bacterium]|nr:hypothetical protein [Verrucomicrobiota bacterium]
MVALEQLRFCRQHLDSTPGGRQRQLINVVDGGYSNRTFFQGLPERTDVVARVRKDAKFGAFLPPDQRRGARKYGPALPTPREYLRDPNLAWHSTTVFVAGQVRTLHYKEVPLLCWPKGTQTRPLRLILIQAAGYRLRKGSKLLYREPAFLITTDLTTPAAELIAAYLAPGKWRSTFAARKACWAWARPRCAMNSRWRGRRPFWSRPTRCCSGATFARLATDARRPLPGCRPGARPSRRAPRPAT